MGRQVVLSTAILLISLTGYAVPLAGDVNSSGAIDATDVQLVINAGLGLAAFGQTDIDHDSQKSTSATDIQLVINAALGLVIDSDGDGLCDLAEVNLGTDPNNPDTDGDGMLDGEEAAIGRNPTVSDGMPTVTLLLPGNVPLVMIKIPAGTFLMGRYPGEQDSDPDEDNQHQVTLTKDYYLGKYPITKAQWTAVMGTSPWKYQGDTYVSNDPNSPAVYISWVDSQSFITQFNKLGLGTARLPTEAEWEYACRAGTTTRFYWGDDATYADISAYAWWRGDALNDSDLYAPHPVGLKLPNLWGLYDMGGNIYEFCQDIGTLAPYPNSAVTDPTGTPGDDSVRIRRGAGIYREGKDCRSAVRHGENITNLRPDVGFRLAM